MFGFLQMTIAAVVGGLVGQFHDGSSRTMALTIGLMGLLALLSHWLLVRPTVQWVHTIRILRTPMAA